MRPIWSIFIAFYVKQIKQDEPAERRKGLQGGPPAERVAANEGGGF